MTTKACHSKRSEESTFFDQHIFTQDGSYFNGMVNTTEILMQGGLKLS